MNDAVVDTIISYLQCNNAPVGPYKVGATIIKVSYDGGIKYQYYIILFPFINTDERNVMGLQCPSHMYVKDIVFNATHPFYLWLYEEMRNQKKIVILTYENYALTTLNGGHSLFIRIEGGDIPDSISFEEWYEKKGCVADFTITLMNPCTYIVPFPVKPILIKPSATSNFVKFESI